jgi:hypothetical protein
MGQEIIAKLLSLRRSFLSLLKLRRFAETLRTHANIPSEYTLEHKFITISISSHGTIGLP